MNNLHDIKNSVRLSSIIGQTVKIKQSGQDEYVALCPFHNEKTPSFHIYDHTGRYWCFGCQAGGDVLDWLKDQRGMDMTEAKQYLGGDVIRTNVVPMEKKEVVPIIPVPTDVDSFQFNHGYSTVHYYRNEDEKILYKVARYEATPFRPKKIFLPATHTKDGWIDKAPTEGRILYNLLSLKNPGMGFIFEGEKCVDVGGSMLEGRACVTWMGGSSTINKTDLTPLQDGRKWCYWPDNDEGGVKTAAYLATIIPDLYVIPLPEGKPKSWDIAASILIDGWTQEDVVGLINKKVLYRDLNQIEAVVELHADMNAQEEEHGHIDNIFPSHLLNAPGLIGRIAKEIIATSVYPRPVLALAAAIACVGVIMGHNFRSESDLRTNMYILGMATSGAGKNWPRVFIKRLLMRAGIMDCFSGAPVSGAAVLTAAAKNNGKGIILWDEFGINAGNISGRNASPHQQQIFQMLMELFTSANDTFIGSEYANKDGKTPRIDIEQPCLNIFATTVKQTFFSSMSSKQSLSGFIPRWLMLDDRSTYKLSIEDITDTNPSEALIDEIKELIGITGIYSIRQEVPTSNSVKPPPYDINPITIPFSPESKIYLRQFEQEIVDRQNNDAKKSNIGSESYCAIWARAREYAIKLALCGHEGVEIDLVTTKWAVELVTYCINSSITEIALSVSDNDQEASTKKVADIVRNAYNKKTKEGITKGKLTKKSYWLASYQRDNIITDLLASHEIEKCTMTISHNPTEMFFPYGKAPKSSPVEK